MIILMTVYEEECLFGILTCTKRLRWPSSGFQEPLHRYMVRTSGRKEAECTILTNVATSGGSCVRPNSLWGCIDQFLHGLRTAEDKLKLISNFTAEASMTYGAPSNLNIRPRSC